MIFENTSDTIQVLKGRTTLYSSIKENELNPSTIAQVLKDILPVHFENKIFYGSKNL
jgi:hypothetical protein